MSEVYWAQYRVNDTGLVELIGDERVSPPSAVDVDGAVLAFGAGTGWRAYSELRSSFPSLRVDDAMLPRALEVAQLGLGEFQAGRATTAAHAQPVYLRDQVVALPRA